MTMPFLFSSCSLLLKFLPSINIPSETTTSENTSQQGNSSSSSHASSSSSSSSSSHSSSSSSSSSSSNTSNTSTTSQTPTKAAWTIMLYVCGADLESQSYAGTEYAGYGYNKGNIAGYASMDIDEILSVKNKPSNVNIILETGGAKTWAKTQIKSTELGRWHVANNQLVKDSSLSKASMGKTSTFQSFLEWGFESYPADKYGVFMWNHGGAMSGCCFDENYSDDSLTADEIDDALTNARNNKKVTNKLEFIAYDACLMAVQDIAEINSHHFNYMVASQESEYAGGYDYDAWLPTIYNNTSVDGKTVCEKIASTFMDEQNADAKEYNDYYNLTPSSEDYWPYDQTQAVYDLNKMEAYKTAFEALATKLYSTASSSTLKTAINKATKYGYYDDDYYNNSTYNYGYLYNVFDVEEAVTEIGKSYSSLSTEVSAVKTALNNLVVYEEHGKDTSGCGLNFYYPIAKVDYKSTISAQTNFTEWYKLITKSGFGSWVG